MNPGNSTEILVVDDDPGVLDLLTNLLRQAGYSVRAALYAEMALESAFSYPPALVILDVRMPGIDGFEICRRLKNDSRTADIPVIFVSGLSDVADRVRGFEVGGVDFITKPMRREEVLARVNAHMALSRAMEEINRHNRSLEATVALRTADLLRERNAAQNYLDIAGVALVALDGDGTITMMNRKGHQILALAQGDAVGVNWFERFTPAARQEEARRRYAGFLAGTLVEIQPVLLPVVNARGEQRLLSCNTRWLRDEQGKVCGTLTSGEDVTDRIRIQNELLASEEKYRSYVENAPDGIFLSDAQGRCLDANPAACALLMVSREELLLENVGDLLASAERPKPLAGKLGSPRKNDRNTELTLQRRDGAPIHASVKSVRLADDRILWFCSDISDLRRAELQAIARAQQLDDALKQLHGLTAHMHDSIEQERLATATDIHDQIGALLTGAKMLLNQVNRAAPDLPSEATHLLTEVRAIVGQALTASRGVYARLRPPMLADLGLVETVRWYLQDWAKKSGIQERHYLARLDHEPAESIRMDLFRILQELLTNVARHSGATKIQVRLHEGRGRLVLRVRDNGRGLDLATTPAGFGLLGIRGRLNRFGGSLRIEHLSPGTSLTAEIPVTGSLGAAPPNAKRRRAPRPEKGPQT